MLDFLGSFFGHPNSCLLPPPPTHTHTNTQGFGKQKEKWEKKGKKIKSLKSTIVKKLLPMSKCYCFSNSRASEFFFLGQPW